MGRKRKELSSKHRTTAESEGLNRDHSRPLRAFAHRYGTVLRAWVLFIATIGALHAILAWSDTRIWKYATNGTARVTAWTLSLLGTAARAQGETVSSSLYAVDIIRECTAVNPIILFTAAVVAYPCRKRSKILGVSLGVALILLTNVVRLVSLVYIGQSYPGAFETAHMLVWQSLIIFVTVFLWVLWALTIGGDHELRPS